MKDDKSVKEYVRNEVKNIEQLSYDAVKCEDAVKLQHAVYTINQRAHEIVHVLDNYRFK